MSKKATDIVAYITIIGWIIAFCAGNREESKFHLNQALVVDFVQVILNLLARRLSGAFGAIFTILGALLFIIWVIGLIAAIRGEDKAVPVLGGIQLLK